MGVRCAFSLAWSVVLGLVVGLPVGFSAFAATLDYQSQTGTVSANGSTSTLPSTGQSFPVSGVNNVNLVASAANRDATSSYSAQVKLQTALVADQLQVSGVAGAQSSDPNNFQGAGSASASADVTVLFNLDEPATLQLREVPLSFTGPFVTLRNLDLGFAFSPPNLGGGGFSVTCGSLSDEQCNKLPDLLESGLLVPGGHYEFDFNLLAFQPHGSCEAGCNSAGGTTMLTIVPEPTTALLVMAGALGLAVARRRRA